ncbi:S41 family peptidase [Flavobacterium terrigena]|uniref:Peptidase family S41 n=1 Tax=Flavobacterium terrigena TaxID=402734 RepID=A0A1H6QHB8_9FLAO|nr:S41 family peptidase [Flavobacterium terrigena]SEI43119.1 Peptidase family S41 [Flavobacterium terrigena]
MKKLLLFTSVSLFLSCQSIKQFNEGLSQPIAVSKLQSDVDYSYKKLKQLHPKLYWYISKEKLDYKFDSLKKSIQKPMTGLAFYKELSQVVKTIGQGHLGIYPSLKKLSKKEQNLLKKKGKSPFVQLDFEFLDDKLIITKNRSRHDIKEMTEIVSINNESPSKLIKMYAARISSDGYNTTFYNRYLGKSFGMFYNLDKGKVHDSIQLLLKFEDKDSLFIIKRDTFGNNSKESKIKLSKKEVKEKNKFNSKYGYNKDTKTVTRELKFIENDSSTAIMTIKQFNNGDAIEFYKESFDKLADAKAKNLIIDLRNNPGGRLFEIGDLYGYLVNEPFVFIDNYEVVSRTSKLHVDYFKGGGPIVKFFKILGAPFFYTINFFKVRKEEDKFVFGTRFSKPKNPKPNNFKGKVYVLINGGSFSASSIISSNLKSSKRAFFVGEETGGAYNGTVAANMPLVQLPNSKVNLKIGLAVVSPFGKTDVVGRGIFPDKEIIPTIEDRKNKIDPELNWVLDDIRREKEVEELLKIKKTETDENTEKNH